MIKRSFLAALAVAVASVCSTGVMAQGIIFDNVAGLVVDNAAASDTGAFIESANLDDVTFSVASTSTSIEFSGIYAASPIPGGDAFIAPEDDNFTISIFADGGGTPDVAAGPVATFAVGNNVNRTAGSNPNLANSFDYSADVVFDFAADVTYYLGIVNSSPASDTDQFNIGITGANTGNSFGSFNATTFDPVIQQTFATDFQIIGAATAVDVPAIPEPSTVGLLALGLVGVVARRRR